MKQFCQGYDYSEFTYTPDKLTPEIKAYIIERLGKDQAESLFSGMRWGMWILLDGPHVATGKSTIMDILVSIGYTRVFIKDENIKTIRVENRISDIRPRAEILGPLGIETIY